MDVLRAHALARQRARAAQRDRARPPAVRRGGAAARASAAAGAGVPEAVEADVPPALTPGPGPSAGDERTRILAALAACAGNQSRAARQLGDLAQGADRPPRQLRRGAAAKAGIAMNNGSRNGSNGKRPDTTSVTAIDSRRRRRRPRRGRAPPPPIATCSIARSAAAAWDGCSRGGTCASAAPSRSRCCARSDAALGVALRARGEAGGAPAAPRRGARLRRRLLAERRAVPGDEAGARPVAGARDPRRRHAAPIGWRCCRR